jgi:tetratricopeptide (TPR) repeat protein
MNDDWDWTAADREIGEALALEPGSADVLHAAGSLYLVLGRVSDSVRMSLAAVARDPLRASSCSNLGVAYFADGRLPEAEEAFRTIELRPAAGYTHNGLKRETDDMWRLEGEALVYAAMHRRAKSHAALTSIKPDPLFQKIKMDPRYATLLQKAGLPL